MISLEFETEVGDPVMGIDEAGRGPLAGGVYAAAVSVPLADAAQLLEGAWRRVNDSKKLSPRARDELAETIRNTPGCKWAVASASPAEIDDLNILYATHLAMRRAADAVAAALGTGPKSEFLSMACLFRPYLRPETSSRAMQSRCLSRRRQS